MSHDCFACLREQSDYGHSRVGTCFYAPRTYSPLRGSVQFSTDGVRRSRDGVRLSLDGIQFDCLHCSLSPLRSSTSSSSSTIDVIVTFSVQCPDYHDDDLFSDRDVVRDRRHRDDRHRDDGYDRSGRKRHHS